MQGLKLNHVIANEATGIGGSEKLSLTADLGYQGPYNPCNYTSYIYIVIFPNIDNTQPTGHN